MTTIEEVIMGPDQENEDGEIVSAGCSGDTSGADPRCVSGAA